jgi:hypothetical protein
MANGRTHNIYVIKLDRQILKGEKPFKNANPRYIQGKPCVYVGMTSKSPKERFMEHRLGHNCSRYAQKYGMFLLSEEYEDLNPMTKNQAVAMERQKAMELRARGWAAWYN